MGFWSDLFRPKTPPAKTTVPAVVRQYGDNTWTHSQCPEAWALVDPGCKEDKKLHDKYVAQGRSGCAGYMKHSSAQEGCPWATTAAERKVKCDDLKRQIENLRNSDKAYRIKDIQSMMREIKCGRPAGKGSAKPRKRKKASRRRAR